MEAYNRAVSLRRLSFAALCSEEDLLRSVLPEIQEKIADVLRLGVGQASSEVGDDEKGGGLWRTKHGSCDVL